MSFIEPIEPNWGNPFPDVVPEDWEDEDDEQSLTSHGVALKRVLNLSNAKDGHDFFLSWHNGERERAVPAP